MQTGETLDGAAAAAVAAIAAEAEERMMSGGAAAAAAAARCEDDDAGDDERVAAVSAAVAAEFGEGRGGEEEVEGFTATASALQRRPSNPASSPPARVTLTLSESSRLAAAARTAALSS